MVLLHGSFSTTASNFSVLAPALVAAGRCVYALDYGSGGVLAVTDSATRFADLVGTVRRLTGAGQVDVIGYSQGGLVLRTALRLNDLAAHVHTAVLLAPSWHGTTAPIAASVPASLCPACADQVAGSALLRRLAVGGELDGRVQYAALSTTADTVVLPVSSQVPVGPADRVVSLLVQDRCPGSTLDHAHLPAAPGVIDWTLSALQTAGRPTPAALTC